MLIATLPVAGLGFGLWERGSTIAPWVIAPSLLLLFATWALGHAGAMWLNAELDRDQGAVLLGKPVEVPRGTALLGYVALAGSVALSLGLGVVPTVCTGACAILSVLYSHPRVALKGRSIGGPLVNGAGYGTLSPTAGWAVAETPPTWRAAIVVVLGAAFILAVYFAAQAFQADEDRRRGYRTLVVTHGPRFCLHAARLSLLVSVAGMSVLAITGAFPRLILVGVPIFWLADRHLARWSRLEGGGTGRHAVTLVGWLVLATFVVVCAAYADHFWAMAQDAPLGGCGTAIVPRALDDVCR